MIRVLSDAPPESESAEALLRDIRSVSVPGVQALVGGETARRIDLRASFESSVPWAVVWICLSTFAVLFLAFGSVVMPLKAIVMNLLSLTASFGALVWIFQDGRFERLLAYQSPGNVELTIPVVMFAVLFGLAMDYELFLLSRIREAYDHAHDTRASVSIGLELTGRIITRAAILLVAVMIGFMSADMLLVKELGVAMAIAIILDVTIVRVLLVPATMQLLGRFNWWAPRWLAALWRRWGIGVEEGGA
jgi:trehalose monomycolate/heme transporter